MGPIAALSGEADVTMPAMTRALSVCLLAAALSLAACGDDAQDTGALEELTQQVADATAAAEAAAADVERLEERVDDLNTEDAKTATRLDFVAERLKTVIADLRASLREAKAGAGSAAAAAQSAAAEVDAVMRELAVLENRFDYHLRRDHGGG